MFKKWTAKLLLFCVNVFRDDDMAPQLHLVDSDGNLPSGWLIGFLQQGHSRIQILVPTSFVLPKQLLS